MLFFTPQSALGRVGTPQCGRKVALRVMLCKCCVSMAALAFTTIPAQLTDGSIGSHRLVRSTQYLKQNERRTARPNNEGVAEPQEQVTRGSLRRGDDRSREGSYVDTHTLTARRGQTITIDLQSDDFDTYLSVQGGEGNQFFVENDDFMESENRSQITMTAPSDGEYQIKVTSYEAGQEGKYRLTITRHADRPRPEGGGRVERGVLSRGDERSGDGSYFDIHTLRARSGEKFTIDLESEEFDTFLLVLSKQDDDFVLENDDFKGSSNHSQILMTAPFDGLFEIHVTSYESGQSGAYRLTITPERAQGGSGPHGGPPPIPESMPGKYRMRTYSGEDDIQGNIYGLITIADSGSYLIEADRAETGGRMHLREGILTMEVEGISTEYKLIPIEHGFGVVDSAGQYSQWERMDPLEGPRDSPRSIPPGAIQPGLQDQFQLREFAGERDEQGSISGRITIDRTGRIEIKSDARSVVGRLAVRGYRLRLDLGNRIVRLEFAPASDGYDITGEDGYRARWERLER